MQKREIYLDNYWLLFLDFIDVFGKLTYNSIPLPLLANFYQYLDNNLKEEMSKSDFKKHFIYKSLSSTQIQPEFERWLNPLKQPLLAKPLQGKLLLNFDYLRFSHNNYIQYFDPEETVIFARWEKNKYLNIPVHCIVNYRVEVQETINELINKANMIFKSVNTHPVYGNQFFYNTFINKIPQMVETIAAVNRYLEEEPVSCVIVGTTEEIISRILTIVAASKGIPSICLQHGLLGGDEAFIPVFSTIVAVYGHYEKNWYLKKGLAETRIVITGHPRFDDIFTKNHMSKKRLAEKCNLNLHKKTILFATQPNYVSLWNQLIEIMAKNPQIEIVIKPHPWELSRGQESTRKLMDNYEAYVKKYKSVKLISIKGFNLYDILPNVDAVVCNLSTVVLEAMLCEKPVFILSNKHLDYFDKLGEFSSSNPAELARLIGKILKDTIYQQQANTKRDEFLAYTYPQKLSGVRLIEEINKLTEKIN